VHFIKGKLVKSAYDELGRLVEEKMEGNYLSIKCCGSIRFNRYTYYNGLLTVVTA